MHPKSKMLRLKGLQEHHIFTVKGFFNLPVLGNLVSFDTLSLG